jgi:hypothetical protein
MTLHDVDDRAEMTGIGALAEASNASKEAAEYAEEGLRLVANGKTIWAGLGNRSGLHSYADELIRDKWEKSGFRLQKKLDNLPDGTEIEVKRFRNTTRDRGRWHTVKTLIVKNLDLNKNDNSTSNTTPGQMKPKKVSAKHRKIAIQTLEGAFERDVKLSEIALIEKIPPEGTEIYSVPVNRPYASEYAVWDRSLGDWGIRSL